MRWIKIQILITIRKNDILYISFESSEDSYGEHLTDDIILMKDIDEPTVITGMTIMGFKRLYNTNPDSLTQLSNYSIGINDVIEKIQQ